MCPQERTVPITASRRSIWSNYMYSKMWLQFTIDIASYWLRVYYRYTNGDMSCHCGLTCMSVSRKRHQSSTEAGFSGFSSIERPSPIKRTKFPSLIRLRSFSMWPNCCLRTDSSMMWDVSEVDCANSKLSGEKGLLLNTCSDKWARTMIAWLVSTTANL